MASVYDVGTRAWQPDAADGWIASELVNKAIDGDKAKLTFKLENGEVCLLLCHAFTLNLQKSLNAMLDVGKSHYGSGGVPRQWQ
jgi:hypothetical protein